MQRISSNDRTYIWQSAYNIFKDNLFGIGVGNAYEALIIEGYTTSKTGLHNPFFKGASRRWYSCVFVLHYIFHSIWTTNFV